MGKFGVITLIVMAQMQAMEQLDQSYKIKQIARDFEKVPLTIEVKDQLWQLAKGGDLEAQFILGQSYLDAVDPYKVGYHPDNFAKGFEEIKKAALGNFVEAQYQLARLYFNKDDREEGLRWLKQAAESNHKEALHELAKLYEVGFVKVDLTQAQQMYEKAWLKHQYIPSALQLAALFERLGGDANQMKAIELLHNVKSGAAAFQLAELYAKKNLKCQALSYYLNAFQYGNIQALEPLKVLALQEEGGDTSAQIAFAYAEGNQHMPINLYYALQWFAISAQKGNRKALNWLIDQAENKGNFAAIETLAKLYQSSLQDGEQLHKWQTLSNPVCFQMWQKLLMPYQYLSRNNDENEQAYWQAGKALYSFYSELNLLKEMLQIVQTLANSGSPQAQYELAHIYAKPDSQLNKILPTFIVWQGNFKQALLQNAFNWYYKALNNKKAEVTYQRKAASAIARLFESGDLNFLNDNLQTNNQAFCQAIIYYQKAKQLGDVKALQKLQSQSVQNL